MTNELARVKNWFELAVPSPTDKNRTLQLGVHFEEISEMFAALGSPDLYTALSNLATAFKTGVYESTPVDVAQLAIDRKELLDAMCDQIVTAVGVMHMFGMDSNEAMKRINDSNWSKFVDGKPVFDENGKIKKGPSYTKPDLEGLY